MATRKLLGALVILSCAVGCGSAPQPAQQYAIELTTDQEQVTSVGPNNFTLSLRKSGPTGQPVTGASVQLTFVAPTPNPTAQGPLKITASEVGDGRYTASTAFGRPGKWTLSVEVSDGSNQAQKDFDIDVIEGH